MGLLPRDFYMMEIEDYLLKKRGYFNKLVYEKRVLREAVWRIISPWVKNLPPQHIFWPIPGDKDLLKEMKAAEGKIGSVALERLRKKREAEK